VTRIDLSLALLLAAQAVLAWLVTRRDLTHRWLAGWLTALTLSVVLSPMVKSLFLTHPRPYTGIRLVARHADRLVFMSFHVLLLAGCLRYFTRVRWWIALVVLAAAELCFLGLDPLSSEEAVQIYRVVSIGCVATAWGCILHGLLLRRELRPGLAHLVLMLYAGTEVTQLLVPMARDFFAHWHVIGQANVVLFTLSAIAHLWWLARSRRTMPAV
jgi:hypothetical protein